MPDICQSVSDIGVAKAEKSSADLFILSILAGAYIALAAVGSTMVAFNLLANPETYGLGRCLAGCIFPVGLMLVVLAGAELFTGNVMLLLPLVQRRISLFDMLRNWIIVYAGNFIGALFVAFLIYHSGYLNAGGMGILKSVTVGIATSKCSLTFVEALTLGILCNWLVCLAVWMALGTKDTTGKILAVFFPIWLFVASGFEHSIANMYYIPIGLLAAQSPWVGTEALTWENFYVSNLIPVTLGNIIGGGVLVALVYGYVWRK